MHYLAFDTETTGFGPSAKIVELSVVFFTGGEVVEEWSELFWPGDINWDKAQKALEVNGLSREQLQGKPKFYEVRNEIVERFKGEKVWVSHNTPFDMKMLEQEFKQLGEPMPRPDFSLDTMMLDVYCNQYVKSRKLDFVSARWNIVLEGAHRASADAIACGKVLWAMAQSGKLPDDIEDVVWVQTERRTEWDNYVKRKYGS